MGCGTATQLRGRWSSNDNPKNNGSFTIKVVDRDPLRFEGTATPDGGAKFKWTGEWSRHFDGDGCCVAAKKPKAPACRKPSSAYGATAGCLTVTYEMPERFGLDQDDDGLVDYQTTAAQIAPKGWKVELKVNPGGESCNILKTLEWRVEGKVAKFKPTSTSRCQVQYRFPHEGVFDVSLKAPDYRGTTRTAALKVNVQDFLVIGVGDSLSSGEGSPDRVRSGTTGELWENRRCHRSAHSWQALIAKDMEEEDEQSSVTFVHLACSGAQMLEGLLGGYLGIEVPGPTTLLPAQVDEARRLIGGREVDAVLMTIGVNDLAFSTVLGFCVKYPFCYNRTFENNLTLDAATKVRLGALPGRYKQLSTALGRFVKAQRVFISHYPNILAKPGGGVCDEVLDDAVPYIPGVDISSQESQWLFDSFLVPLNGRVSDAGRDLGWTVVPGAREAFAGHGYCATAADRWVVRYTESVARQGNEAGTLHPNPAGHQAMERLAEPLVKKAFFPSGSARAGK
jgi:lysophospholipase L1-like esterase